MIETGEIQEKVILVGISAGSGEDCEASLDELAELVGTAGGLVAGRLIQSRESAHPGTYLGKGKLSELKWMVWENDATGVVCDDELSPAQLKNMEEALETKVMDRTLVILDIFARHASTREGKIQVELAQLRYRAARLTGLGSSLSRLGGGIGTRGPGESKLESDRRAIHRRIGQLKGDLEQVKKNRDVTRKQRGSSGMLVAAIVGYTNAGKSTLLNRLTDAGILAQDQLFATLDPTTRKLELPSGDEMLLTDTVGFIRKLPHNLIEAFKSTLEEAKYADIILHVVDASNPHMEMQMHVVYETLRELGVEKKTVITLFNKIDRAEKIPEILKDYQADEVFKISAATGEGIPAFLDCLDRILRSRKVYLSKTYPYSQAGRVQYIRKYGQLLTEEYLEEGIKVTAYMPAEFYRQAME